MGTQLLKAGRVSVEERLCAAGAKKDATRRPVCELHKQHTGLNNYRSASEYACLKVVTFSLNAWI